MPEICDRKAAESAPKWRKRQRRQRQNRWGVALIVTIITIFVIIIIIIIVQITILAIMTMVKDASRGGGARDQGRGWRGTACFRACLYYITI